jgi:hypothetical protein
MDKSTQRKRILKKTKTISIIVLVLFGLWVLGATEGNAFDHFQWPWIDTSEGSDYTLSKNMDSYVKGWTGDYQNQMEKSDNAWTYQAAAVTTHLSGPVVVIDPSKRQIQGDLQSRLPSSLKPKNAQDVRIIVWVDRYTRATSSYSDGTSAFTWFSDQTFVDADSHAILGYTEVMGGDPPDYVYTNGSRTGDEIPGEDIVSSIAKWIQNTPNSNN